MKIDGRVMEKTNNLMPRLCGFVVSSILTFVVIMTTWNFGVVYEHRIQAVAILVTAIWFILLVRAKGIKDYKIVELLFAAVLLGCLGLYIGAEGWHRGYITNTPLIGINAETDGIHRDTLYHNAIASSIAYYGYPSLLVNSGAFHNYHFGSHMILGLISRVMNMPTIFTYCYIFPVLFWPSFMSLILSIGSDIRMRFNKSQKITIIDIFVLLGFMTWYILPKEISNLIGDGHSSSFLISESYCVALVLGLTFFKIWLQASEKKFFENKYFATFFAVVVVPVFIVATGVSKISVGLIFTFMICYYLFRTKWLNLKFIVLEVCYVIIIFAVHYIPAQIYSPILSGSTEEIYSLQWLAYMKNNFDPRMWGVHIISLFFYAFVFVVWRTRGLSEFKDFIAGIKNRNYVVEETLVLACIAGTIPGLFIDIGGGSAYYFFSIQMVTSTTLLIGYGIPLEIVDWIKEHVTKNFAYKVACSILIICFCFNFYHSAKGYAIALVQDCKLSSVQYEESSKEGSFWRNVIEINTLTGNNKNDYYIYVCPSAVIWSKYANPDSAIFFYPAMTGIVCIGELYFQEGQLYTNNDVAKTAGYTYRPAAEDQKMTEDDAYIKAKEDGKKAIIYIYDNTYSVRNIEE